jgi:hypothetical protein
MCSRNPRQLCTASCGLLIAVLIEQTVEFFHDRHQRNRLEEQMHEVFEGNLRSDQESFRQLGAVRREKGTIALLPTDRIRVYNRVAFQRELTAVARDQWLNGLADISAFQERFVDSTGSLALGEVVTAPQLQMLSAGELSEYLTIVAALIKKTDLLNARLHLFDLECRAIFNGVRTEDELIRLITPQMIKGSS